MSEETERRRSISHGQSPGTDVRWREHSLSGGSPTTPQSDPEPLKERSTFLLPMDVLITGAYGRCGTAVIDHLHDDPEYGFAYLN